MKNSKVFKKYFWILGLVISCSYLIFEGLVQNGYLSMNDFRDADSKIPKIAENSGDIENPESQRLDRAEVESEGQAEVKELPNKNEASRDDVLNGLHDSFLRDLAEKGFTGGESESAFSQIKGVFSERRDGVDTITVAVEEAAKALSLSTERKNLLREALLDSLNEAGGLFTFEELKDCLEGRAKKFKADTCSKQIMDELIDEIGVALPTNLIARKHLEQLEPLNESHVRRLVKECRLNPAQATDLLSLHLQNCS